MTRIGIVGCGAIGTALAVTLDRDYASVAQVVALVDQIPAHARALQARLGGRPAVTTLSTLIRRSNLVLEAASVSVSADVARRGLAAHRDVLVMSTGGLLLDASWRRAASGSRGRLYLPSGALGGLDALKAFARGRLRRIRLTTRKPPASLASAPLVRRHRLRLTGLRRPRVIFEGTPREAIRGFPQNTNVAATLALTVLSAQPRAARPVPIRIRVVADPSALRNSHELEVDADAGRLTCRVESRPSTQNPKTSQVAIDAAMATLAQLFEPVRIGT